MDVKYDDDILYAEKKCGRKRSVQNQVNEITVKIIALERKAKPID